MPPGDLDISVKKNNNNVLFLKMSDGETAAEAPEGTGLSRLGCFCTTGGCSVTDSPIRWRCSLLFPLSSSRLIFSLSPAVIQEHGQMWPRSVSGPEPPQSLGTRPGSGVLYPDRLAGDAVEGLHGRLNWEPDCCLFNTKNLLLARPLLFFSSKNNPEQ